MRHWVAKIKGLENQSLWQKLISLCKKNVDAYGRVEGEEKAGWCFKKSKINYIF